MFRMRRRFGGGNRFRKHRKPVKWNAVSVQGANNTEAIIQELPIVVAGDYEAVSTLSPSGVSVVRCVGEVLIYPTNADASNALSPFIAQGYRAIFTVGIAHSDTDEGVSGFSPGSASDLINERWLWRDSKGVMVPVSNVAAGSGVELVEMLKFNFDIRQRVKLRDSGISLYWIFALLTGTAGKTWNASLTARTLLQGEFA